MNVWRLLSLVAEKVEAKSAYPQHGCIWKFTVSCENQTELLCPQNLTHALFLLLFAADLHRRHLRVAPVVEDADLMHALDRAGWRTPLFGFVLAPEIFHRVLFERCAGIATLLRAPVHQAVFADVEIARAGATAPFVRLAFGDAVLKPVEPRVILVAEFLHRMKDLLLGRSEERRVGKECRS